MGIQERPFENIISMNNSLSGDPINELITLNKLERSIYSEGRKLETIILLSGMTPKDRWIYISLILDDLLYQYDISCRKVRGMNANTLLYKRALLLKKAIVEVMEVTSTRLKIAFDTGYIKEREEGYATTGAARWDDSTDKKLDLDIVESMRYFNDLISGKIGPAQWSPSAHRPARPGPSPSRQGAASCFSPRNTPRPPRAALCAAWCRRPR